MAVCICSFLVQGILLATLAADEEKSSITVEAGLECRRLFDKALDYRLMEHAPRLDAISNPDYGSGVVAASTYFDALQVFVLNGRTVTPLVSFKGFKDPCVVRSVRFDRTGLFGHALYVMVAAGEPPTSHFVQITPAGEARIVASFGKQSLSFDINDGSAGFMPGAYIQADGSTIPTMPRAWRMTPQFRYTLISLNNKPGNRASLNAENIRFDTTGVYGWHVLVVDCDRGASGASAIYKMTPDLVWTNLVPAVPKDSRCYKDLAISTKGAFGQRLYITDSVANTVEAVTPEGDHKVIASGFDGAEGVAVSDDGNVLYVSDRSGVFVIAGPGSSASADEDCNGNAVPDSWDLYKETSADCNQNGIPDECDISSGTSTDCNANGIPDSCEVTGRAARDCNRNAIPDDCDIASGVSKDTNKNGWPDECEPALAASTERKSFDLIWQVLTVATAGLLLLLWLIQRRQAAAAKAAEAAKLQAGSRPT